jgi:hypothetical protein
MSIASPMNSTTSLRRAVVLTATALWALGSLQAATYSGSNPPGGSQDFAFTPAAGAASVSLTVAGTPTAYSHLLLKRGSAPSATDYDFAARLNGQGNALHLELPELEATNYVVRVLTPAASTTHAFTLTVDENQPGLRTAAKPVAKRLTSTTGGLLAPGEWHYFQVEVPAGLAGWINVLNATNAADLYVRRGALPDTSTADRASVNQAVDTIIFSDTEATAGTYFVGVYVPATAGINTPYVLQTAPGALSTLNWDPGTADGGTEMVTQNTSAAGDFYFKITPQSAAVGVWRTALEVTAGEANVFLQRGLLPSPTAHLYGSTRPGSDGFVAHSTEFEAGQEWFILVRAAAGAQWRLWSGDAFVRNLGALAADASSGSGPMQIGPEGMRFFRTTIPVGTLAWRLGLNGGTQPVLVKKNVAPHPITSGNWHGYDLQQAGQMLVVPGYLAPGSEVYFVGVTGAPGEAIDLDSRRQAVTDVAFDSTSPLSVAGYGYATFRVQVPAQQVGWQVTVTPTSGDPNLAVRRGEVPNEGNNDAFSEAGAGVADSVALAPPLLGDGTAYITVYGTGDYTCTLTTGDPRVTDINYVDVRVNDEPSRAGWKFYRAANLAQQSGTLGWELWLAGQAPSTEIAIRQNALPFRRNYRTDGGPYVNSSGHVDQASTEGWLQQPQHEEDIWYVGVYSPDEPLGAFTLHTAQLTPTALPLDGGAFSRTDMPANRWEFFRVDVPADAIGWDIRLANITAGQPRLVVRRGQLPTSLSTGNGTGGPWWYPFANTTWQIGNQWAAGPDWTGLSYGVDGTEELGRILAVGLGNPLEAGTYYVGVHADQLSSYVIESREIGVSTALPVTDLAFTGGNATNDNLLPRTAAYYRVQVPAGAASWQVKLTATEGEVLLLAQQDAVPSVERALNQTRGFNGGRLMQKTGDEQFVLLPLDGQDTLAAGTYYLAVVGEGQNPQPASGRIGTGPSRYVLRSLGELPVTNLGALGGTDLVRADTLAAGEYMAYQFTAPPGTPSVELVLEDRSGNPAVAAVPGGVLPCGEEFYEHPTFDRYGVDGGRQRNLFESSERVTLVNLDGVYSVGIKANGATPASFTLRVRAVPPTAVSFDGGASAVSDQLAGAWRYFRIDVPVGCAGWDLRLANVTRGEPKLVVRRDQLPNEVSTSSGPEWPEWHWYGPTAYTNWPSGYQWAPWTDWTGRQYSSDGTANETGRVLIGSMGNPLEPGIYYVGVFNAASSGQPATYTFTTRGIGSGLAIPVVDLAFAGGSATNLGLAAREATHYRVTVPPGATSWQIQLAMQQGEAMLAVHHAVLPTTDSGMAQVGYPPASGGRHMHKAGNDHFVLLPENGQTALVAGDYFLSVVSEGQDPAPSWIGTNASRFILSSVGEIPVDDLGLIGATPITRQHTLEGGSARAYRFTVPAGAASVDLRLLDRTNRPVMTVRPGLGWPYRLSYENDTVLDYYGIEGGQGADRLTDDDIIGIANPLPGTYSLLIKARPINSWGDDPLDAAYTLSVRAADNAPVAFDGGSVTLTNQSAGAWQHFVVEVPPDTQGWDVRLAEVVGGHPKLVIRRGALPQTPFTEGWSYNAPYSHTNWPVSYQIAAGQDWTRRDWTPDWSVNESGRILAMGMGNPLEPGTYYVGVFNDSTIEATSYRLISRGIGEGRALPIVDLPFAGGSVTNSGLLPREAAYYRVMVPPGSGGWKVRLTALSGESLLAAVQATVPNTGADLNQSVAYPPSGWSIGRRMQKAGNEHFTLLPREHYPPTPSELFLPEGAYYLAVVGEGVNPLDASRIGTGSSSYVLESLGAPVVTDLGLLSPVATTVADALEGGEVAAYRFAVPHGTLAIEATLLDRQGNPVLAFRPGDAVTYLYDYWNFRTLGSYGVDGGYSSGIRGDSSVLSLANPVPDGYSLVVKATTPNELDSSPDYPDSTYTLRVRTLTTPELNISAALNTNGLPNSATGLLADKQRAFFKVVVPDTLAGQPLLGWKLDLALTQGAATFRVRRDQLPADNDNTTTAFAAASAVLVPPFLTPGTWFVEVLAAGSTEFTLTSSVLALERSPWLMPAPGQPTTTPGLTAPEFGDSGVDAVGQPLPGDQGLYLDQGRYHYYAFVVPTNNLGLVRATLEAISGNPDLFARVGAAPTDSHGSTGNGWTDLIHRALQGTTGTEHGNWVPAEGRSEARLTPGTWFVAVRAVGGSNARYRLRLSTGTVQDLTLNGGSATSQNLTAGDWRYYRVQIPSAAPAWSVSFAEQSGEVELFLRDTSPPGRGLYGDWYPVRDWSTDAKNQGPYPSALARGTHTLAPPPLRPGYTYYLGFRAKSDAVFSVSSATSGSPLTAMALDFYAGTVNTSLTPHGSALYRVDVPTEASRWRHTATHASEVAVCLEQGTVPRFDQCHWKTYWADTPLNQPLSTNSWPWLPGQSYFLLVTNTTDQTLPFSLRMDGRTAATEDEDVDGLPDAWETRYFGSPWSQYGDWDPDGDGLTNLQEYQLGTNPTDGQTRGRLDSIQLNGTTLQMHFTGETGLRYELQGSDDLQTWNPMLVLTNTTGALWLDEAMTNPALFYRTVIRP